jgi:uncharacterized protein (DUF362 family)
LKPFKISRRSFVRLALLGGIGAGMAIFKNLTAPLNPISYLRWKLRGLWLQNYGQPSIVAIERCSSYALEQVSQSLTRLWELAQLPSPKGKSIFIKPNLVDTLDQITNITPAAEVITSLVDLLQSMRAKEVKVGDGPAFRRDAHAVAREIGLEDGLKRRSVPFVDLNYDDPQPVRAKDGWFPGNSQIWLPRSILEADLVISLAKMKTHHWAKVSLCMKNLLGIFPGARYGWPKNFIHFSGIPQSILGIYQLLPEVLGIVDGIVGMEGDGPLFGEPVPHGILLAGSDPVAVDVVGKELMGFGKYEVDYLNLAAWAGVGQAERIDLRGLTSEGIRRTYARPPAIE